jgi:hypothetical protein
MSSKTERCWTHDPGPLQMTRSGWRAGVALLGSFAVYFIPLIGPHAAWFLGASLVAGFGAGRPPAWVAADISVALAAQITAGLALYWSLGGGWARKLVWLGIVPLTIALNFAYLSAIPGVFLIEADTAPEVTTWVEHCFVRAVSLRPVGTSAVRTEKGVTAWWAARSGDGRDTLLRVPECGTADAVLPTPGKSPQGHLDFFTSLPFASSDGIAIVEQLDRRSSRRTWSTLSAPAAPLQRLAESSETLQSPPIISRRGDAVAWVTIDPASGPPVLSSVLVRKATPGSAVPEIDIDLAAFGPGIYVPLDVDATRREALLWRDDRPLLVGFDGRSRPVSFEPGDIRAQSTTYLRLGDGWVAWDAYRETGPYQISWSLAGRTGWHRTNAGRSVTSAAVDPTGSYIAVSETTTLSLGNASDVVYVLRTHDGREVFRRYLPRYSRSPVVFFDGGFLGYSDMEGTHILKLP